jgi:hypothetical protein
MQVEFTKSNWMSSPLSKRQPHQGIAITVAFVAFTFFEFSRRRLKSRDWTK